MYCTIKLNFKKKSILRIKQHLNLKKLKKKKKKKTPIKNYLSKSIEIFKDFSPIIINYNPQ